MAKPIATTKQAAMIRPNVIDSESSHDLQAAGKKKGHDISCPYKKWFGLPISRRRRLRLGLVLAWPGLC
jgi:hypothetical protein